MIRRDLERVRDELRARMEAGERLCWTDALEHANSTLDRPASRSWAHEVLKLWHDQGEIHIAEYRRGRSGPARPYFAWGAGQDAPRPAPTTSAEHSRRWRRANPDRARALKNRSRLRARIKNTIISPLAILLGPQNVPADKITMRRITGRKKRAAPNRRGNQG